ncbi:radical SAM protein [Aliikangiella coralliicola]|uniref:Radical SAM protein n=1 Tax=Aliikangiella coralliicola TaxID=2592383 RepID=A0A545UJ73_9GAMM|nr:radical SAM protein [Aliikangiella coralliicola]TQV89508.1 radical SAM protein [Aliikangiella coralliicola]
MHTLKWLVLGVNNICNLHCKMCDVGTGSKETNFSENLIGARPIDMPLELFREISLQAKSYFPNAKLGYAFTEPLIYKYLEESLEIACVNELEVAITTNGLKLKQKANAILEYGVENIFLSLDGTEEIHNSIRGNKYSFQKALDGIEELIKHAKRPKISIFCVITEWNIGNLSELVEFFSQYPIEQLGFMHTNFTTVEMAQEHNMHHGYYYHATHSNIEEINIDEMNLDLLWSDICRIKSLATDFKVSFSPEIETREMLDVFYHKPKLFIGRKCLDIYRNIMLKSDGSVIPAHGRCFNLELGNLYQSDLLTIWQSQVLRKLQLDLDKAGGLFPACARCCSAFH